MIQKVKVHINHARDYLREEIPDMALLWLMIGLLLSVLWSKGAFRDAWNFHPMALVTVLSALASGYAFCLWVWKLESLKHFDEVPLWGKTWIVGWLITFTFLGITMIVTNINYLPLMFKASLEQAIAFYAGIVMAPVCGVLTILAIRIRYPRDILDQI